ncbi:MAG TPA: AraC family transcriptional regulator [Niastella sp.]
MIKESIHQSLEVVYRKVKVNPIKKSRNTFFQMVYVISGKGFIAMNGNRKPYKEGGLMLLTPNDSYAFEMPDTTEFVFIKFSNSYVKEFSWKHLDCLECLLYYAPSVSGCVMKSQSDMLLVKKIVDALLQEIQNDNLYNKDLIMHFVNALIVIAARNISQIYPQQLKPNADSRIQDIIHYIQSNIYSPQQLKATQMAIQFGIATTYLGSYFKHQCGETIQQFIANYRLRLIEHRLRFSDMRINEIVNEFGFSDESHLNKFFKKHKKVSLTEYRKSNT